MMALPPISPEVQELLTASRGIAPLPPSVEARCLARSRALAASSTWVPHRAAPAPRWIFAAAVAAIIAVGAAAYAAHSWLVEEPANRNEALPESFVRAVVTTRATERPVAAVPAVELAPPIPMDPPPARSRGRSRATAARSASVAELRLLMSVREDVVHGDFNAALAVIAEHARRFRNGALVEEREALRVESLAGLGRQADARRAAGQFHERFPHSVLLSTFERMTEPVR